MFSKGKLSLSMSSPQDVLRKYWGHDQFRPKQEEVIQCLLDGRDVAVVMPTGGGKSLCYQLPPIIANKTCVVISPLISLMADQAAHLREMGIPAAAIHSGVDWEQQKSIWNQAIQGKLRLLYLSPERLASDQVCELLTRVNATWFAIDEAHCISEWGHEFRPEYRALGKIRERFPNVTIAAFTASATPRVRHDILNQLQLKDPGKFIVSFHRANLNYMAIDVSRKDPFLYLLAALQQHDGESIIVYAGKTQLVDDTAAALRAHGVRATSYHGKMPAELRQKNQELWMSNEAPVMVGTLAFGLGINKPSTRAVIHLSLPKSIEQYYQEAGRAGRDGLPADCILLWQKRDFALLAHFIEETKDPLEKRRGWQRYREITGFADAHKCRALLLCEHFGEMPKWDGCGQCDICAGIPSWLTPKRPPKSKPVKPVRGEKASFDTPIQQRLRAWRKVHATSLGVPAFQIMPDAVLLEIAERMPRSESELLAIKGFGPKRFDQFGMPLLDLIDELR
jgi:ATP-dependent DNA helicase RecQ